MLLHARGSPLSPRQARLRGSVPALALSVLMSVSLEAVILIRPAPRRRDLMRRLDHLAADCEPPRRSDALLARAGIPHVNGVSRKDLCSLTGNESPFQRLVGAIREPGGEHRLVERPLVKPVNRA